MAFTVLRTYLRNVCWHRHHFVLYRSLSVNPLTEVKNPSPLKQENHEESSNSLVDSQKVSYEFLVTDTRLPFKATDAVLLLQKLRTLKLKSGIEPEMLLNDDRFLKICQVLEKGFNIVKPVQLVIGLRCLLELGLPPKMKVVQVIENEVLWMSRKMSVKTLCICLDFHTNFQETDQQKIVVKELVTLIKNRWLEIENTFEVIAILNNKEFFDESFIVKVEDKVLEFADKIPLDEIALLVTTLSRQKRRPAPVLRALSYYLAQKQESLTLRQCADLCFALKSLRFIDVNILNKVTVDALASLESNIKGSLVSSLMTSISLLKWDHYVLLESCCQWVEKNSEQLCRRDWASLVISLAHLNYQPEKGDVLLSLALESLKPSESQELSPSVWLDVVWALAILGKATPEHLASVLKKSFYGSLICDDVPNSVVNKLKLQNLDAVSKVEFPSAKLPPLDLPLLPQVPSSTADQKLRTAVIEALKTFLPPPNYLGFNLQTSLGFIITGEFIVDEKGNPVQIVGYGVKAGNGSIINPLPGNLKRIALLTWGFKDLTAKSNNTTGLNSLSVRLLKKLGYTVVEVTYTEFQNLKTTVQQVQYLQQKVKEKIPKTQ